MHEITHIPQFIIGVILTLIAINMLREKNAGRIRNSRYWWAGFLAYLFLISVAGSLVCNSIR